MKTKLIYIISILATSTFSLMSQIPAIKTTDGFEIPRNKFITTAYAKEFQIDAKNIDVVDGNIIGYDKSNAEVLAKYENTHITFEWLKEKNLLQHVFVTADEYNKNTQIIKKLITAYKPIFSNSPELYTKIAKLIIQNAKNESLPTLERAIKTLSELITIFFENNDYTVGFFVTLSLAMDIDIPTINKNYFYLPTGTYFSTMMNHLIKLTTRKAIGAYFDTDNIAPQNKLFNLPIFPAEMCKEKMLKILDDNYIIIATMCELKILLQELATEIVFANIPE